MEIRRSKFHFVDLAGSERAKRTGASGQRFKEVRELVLRHTFAVACREAVGTTAMNSCTVSDGWKYPSRDRSACSCMKLCLCWNIPSGCTAGLHGSGRFVVCSVLSP